MDLRDKVVVVTGGASGIGEALCKRFAHEGARVVVADLNESGAFQVAESISGMHFGLDVTQESQVAELVARTEERYGSIHLYCSNAGVFHLDQNPLETASNEHWQLSWEVNVMAHVYASRAVLPGMLQRGTGYFLITASAAGLLNQVGSASYGTTKHAAIGFAESLSISHGDKGLTVSVLCPQAVDTPMVAQLGGPGVAGLDGMMTPHDLAQVVVDGLAAEQFLILPHPEVLTYMQRKSTGYDRWLKGMRRLRDQFLS